MASGLCVQRLAAIFAVVAIFGLGASRAPASPRPDFFGLSAPELYSMSLDGRFSLRDSALDHIEAAGIDTVRTEIGWRDVEPNPPVNGVHTYNWQPLYGHIAALAEHGQSLAPMIMAPPAWAQPAASAGFCQRRGGLDPARVADYATFVSAVAKTLGRDGSYWRWAATYRPDLPQRPITSYEIFNEPNWDPFWCPEIDPETYATALAAAADAIHAVDPQARVSLGGLVVLEQDQYAGSHLLGMATKRFLERMTAAVPGLGSRIDAVAVHTYWATPAANLRALGLVEGWLDDAGLGDESLVVSEYGWRSGGPAGGLAEGERAQMIADYTDSLTRLARTDCRIVGIFPHDWITPRVNTADPEHWYGLADPLTGAPLASGVAYADTIDAYENRTAAQQPTPDTCHPATAEEPPPPVDVTGPEVSIRRRSKAGVKPVTFALTASDPAGVSALEYRLDGRAWRSTTGKVKMKRPGSRRHVIAARAVDGSGNTGNATSLAWRLRPARAR